MLHVGRAERGRVGPDERRVSRPARQIRCSTLVILGLAAIAHVALKLCDDEGPTHLARLNACSSSVFQSFGGSQLDVDPHLSGAAVTAFRSLHGYS